MECGASGQYQSSYLSTEGDCVYSCQFFVEVVEVISEQILDVFERFRKCYRTSRAGNLPTKLSLTIQSIVVSDTQPIVFMHGRTLFNFR